jgi:hypothetical protein
MAMPDREAWLNGLHQLHCRGDRCVYGCDCPCHRGEEVPELRRQGRLRDLLLWVSPARLRRARRHG